MGELTVQSFAHRFKLNYTYLSRAFKCKKKLCLTEFLQREKMERCADYLKVNDKVTINEVAEIIGYSETRYFIKVFKRYMGMSPGKYRDRNKEQKVKNLPIA